MRNAAKKEAAKLHAGQQARYEAELTKATRDFESGDAQRIQERILSDERTYREYVSASLGLEDQMRKARAVLREEIPKIEKQLKVLERTGVAQLECEGAAWAQRLDKLAAAVDRGYRAVPDALRRDVEFADPPRTASARARAGLQFRWTGSPLVAGAVAGDRLLACLS